MVRLWGRGAPLTGASPPPRPKRPWSAPGHPSPQQCTPHGRSPCTAFIEDSVLTVATSVTLAPPISHGLINGPAHGGPSSPPPTPPPFLQIETLPTTLHYTTMPSPLNG